MLSTNKIKFRKNYLDNDAFSKEELNTICSHVSHANTETSRVRAIELLRPMINTFINQYPAIKHKKKIARSFYWSLPDIPLKILSLFFGKAFESCYVERELFGEKRPTRNTGRICKLCGWKEIIDRSGYSHCDGLTIIEDDFYDNTCIRCHRNMQAAERAAHLEHERSNRYSEVVPQSEVISDIVISQARIFELRSLPYKEYLQTEEWQEQRARCLQRFDYRCAVCNSEDNLHIHHRTYENRGFENATDLTVLCSTCHELFHTYHQLTT